MFVFCYDKITICINEDKMFVLILHYLFFTYIYSLISVKFEFNLFKFIKYNGKLSIKVSYARFIIVHL